MSLDDVYEMRTGDLFTYRGREYVYAGSITTSGRDSRGEYLHVKVWPADGGAERRITIR